MILAWGISWGSSLDVNQGCSHLKAWLGREDPIPAWLSMWLANQLADGKVLSYLPCGSLHWVGWVSLQHDSWLPPEPLIQESQVEPVMTFLTQPQKSHCHFCKMLVVTQVRPNHSRWGLTIQGYEYQEVKITEGLLGDQLPQWQTYSKWHTWEVLEVDFEPRQLLCHSK